MAAHEIHLQLGEPIARDGDLGQLAESGRHAVHRSSRSHDARPRPRACGASARERVRRETFPQCPPPPHTSSMVRVSPSLTILSLIFSFWKCAWRSCAFLPFSRPSDHHAHRGVPPPPRFSRRDLHPPSHRSLHPCLPVPVSGEDILPSCVTRELSSTNSARDCGSGATTAVPSFQVTSGFLPAHSLQVVAALESPRKMLVCFRSIEKHH